MGEGALATGPVAFRLLGALGVLPRAPAVASRFFNVSLFSRCSRAGAFAGRGLVAEGSGLSGEDTAGA